MTSGAEVSVVLQGPVHGLPTDPPERQLTRQVVASVRRHLPGAEVIVSTWNGSPTHQLGADVVIENDDPGAVPLHDGPMSATNNLNRQLVSTQGGLRAATRRYAVKLRTDILLTSPLPVAAIAAQEPTGPRKIFRGKVAVLNLYTRHPLKRPVLFHLSDLFHAGLREDLLTLWEIPLVAEPGFTRTIDPRRRPWIDVYPDHGFLFRASPEQYLGESLCRRLDDSVRLRDYSHTRWTWLELWLAVLASNFRILTIQESGVLPPKRLAGDSGAWDLFQPQDLDQLAEWSSNTIPLSTRCRTASAFFRVQWPYRRAGLSRRLHPRLQDGIRRLRGRGR